jgi:ABC-type nitrate/sulfonate/bicarbonate transport system ATPase subunit
MTTKAPVALLSLDDLSVGYDSPLITGIHLQVYPGEIISIIGASGIGKSTLLRTIAGLVSPLGGSVNLNVAPRGGLGYIPQKLGLIRHASVNHNVWLGARAGLKQSSLRTERVAEAIEKMGLSEKTDEPVRRLSGGQQKRVATARTLAQQPEVILADEFLSELDQSNIDAVVNAMLSYIKQSGSAMILVEHNTQRAANLSTRTFAVKDGMLCEVLQDGGEEE